MGSLSVFFVLFTFVYGCTTTEKNAGLLESGKRDGLPVLLEIKNVRPGLEVIYFHDKFRHVNDIPKSEKGIAKFGRPGPPILQLNHRFGDGKVFASGRSQEVGILMQGYFHLDTPGEYLFQANSNDGIQLYIDGNLVVNDPTVHGDKLSEPGKFTVAQGGMFPVTVKYFQRKGTATLELYWQPPGVNSYSIIPSSVYSH